jgi:hypothetical protein
VKELKGTAYRPSVAILGAKRHYCAHEQVSKAEVMSVDEGCESLLDSVKGCCFKQAVPRFVPFVQASSSLRVCPL